MGKTFVLGRPDGSGIIFIKVKKRNLKGKIMGIQEKQGFLCMVLVAWAFSVCGVLILAGCKQKPAESPGSQSGQQAGTDTEEAEPSRNPAEAQNPRAATESSRPAVTEQNRISERKENTLRLEDVIRAARTWGPVYRSWYGKKAPDFALKDLSGKVHRLSDYRGRNVMLIFWATWCPPCRMEVPDLIRLRNLIGEEELAMLAISCEDSRRVRDFVAKNRINYTVLLEDGNMPVPFGVKRIYSTTGIPCSFFINPDGTVKLATGGLLPLRDARAILQAR